MLRLNHLNALSRHANNLRSGRPKRIRSIAPAADFGAPTVALDRTMVHDATIATTCRSHRPMWCDANSDVRLSRLLWSGTEEPLPNLQTTARVLPGLTPPAVYPVCRCAYPTAQEILNVQKVFTNSATVLFTVARSTSGMRESYTNSGSCAGSFGAVGIDSCKTEGSASDVWSP